MNSVTVFSDAYVVVTLESDVSLVRYTRTALPFPEMTVVREHNAALARVFETLTPQKKLALLVDVRAAPPRNDLEFETEMSGAVAKLMDGFRARAFLVKTAVGGLQIRRLSATRGPAIATFSDEAAALQHLGVQ